MIQVKIVVISDTHMPRMSKKLPERLIAELADADAIVHAGDWTTASVHSMLSAYGPTYGVAGNNDGPELQAKFGLKKVLKLGGCRIGLVHGHGANRSTPTEKRAIDAFKGKRLNAIVYGHSHVPVLKQIGRTLILNPGSPTDKRKQPHYSFAVLRVEGGNIEAILVFYDDKS